jgi:uncharacterized protein YbjT (DUF2867 family)
LLAEDKRFTSVTVVARRKPENLADDMVFMPFDLDNPMVPEGTNVVFCALGTTLKNAGGIEQFIKIDMEGVVSLANKCRDAGVETFIYVSSIGANVNSHNYYLKSKGLTELALIALGFNRLRVLRPSLLLGQRMERRFLENVVQKIMPYFGFLFTGPLRKYRPVKGVTVARAMVELLFTSNEKLILESSELEWR